ncbi:MAG TPA: WecB/TagA/CpsF family glycosyltransferase [Tepidisphaeraceae bacterium]|jgi:exopolysaccharide biosynthesis WecB/TagA/CpsF family protein
MSWPVRHDVFGVKVSATHYAEVVESVLHAAETGQGGLIDFMPAHLLTAVVGDPDLLKRMDDFAIIAPDGQPVRWALNKLYNAGLTDRVYGPETTRRLCAGAAERALPIYLYGGTEAVLTTLCAKLKEWFPTLIIAGSEAPPFRPLTAEEDAAAVERINASGAKLLFIGIGSPKQEVFAHAHRDSIKAVQLCVGAAFDFHAGSKKMAPAWMQKRGLEWLFRLTQEPKRLWKRYLVANSTFVFLYSREILRRKTRKLFGRKPAQPVLGQTPVA